MARSRDELELLDYLGNTFGKDARAYLENNEDAFKEITKTLSDNLGQLKTETLSQQGLTEATEKVNDDVHKIVSGAKSIGVGDILKLAQFVQTNSTFNAMKRGDDAIDTPQEVEEQSRHLPNPLSTRPRGPGQL